MPRREEGVGGAAWRRNGLARGVDHIGIPTISPADTPYVTDIVHQGCQGEMQPVLRGNVAAETLAAQDVLTDKRDHGGMLGRVIERIAGSDALQNKFGCLGNDLGVAWLSGAESACVGGSQLLAQGVGQQFSWIKHDLPFLM